MKRFTLEEIEAAIEEGCQGFCAECGLQHDRVEPDAREYGCEDCGTPTVYGAEELLLMGLVR